MSTRSATVSPYRLPVPYNVTSVVESHALPETGERVTLAATSGTDGPRWLVQRFDEKTLARTVRHTCPWSARGEEMARAVFAKACVPGSVIL